MKAAFLRRATTLVALSMAWGGAQAFAQQLSVVNISPTRNGLDAGLNSAITVEFDRAVDPATFTSASFRAFGRWSGPVAGALHFSDDNKTVTLQPERPFAAGELISVNLSKNLRAADASPMRNAGYSYQFWTRTRTTGVLDFTETATMTTGVNTRPYAGMATDLNNDGWLDLTVVNEDSADLRVFMNDADGTVGFAPYIQPTNAVANRASPSESHDFNNDGFADMAVANINNNSVSILLGRGDGTYSPQQKINVGNTPRGLAVLDADGDGDMDVVNTNFSSNNLSLLLNNGSGVFGSPTNFQGGVGGERSLAAGDMNNDGIADLVVGGYSDSTFQVLRGNGNGTFTPMPTSTPAGGQTWSIALGDVNGDGNLDVVSANGYSENGSVALGAGNGVLGAPTIYNTLAMGDGGNSTPTGMSLGDLDGDGDFDWVVSPYGNGGGAGDWLVMLNNGSGAFAFQREIPSVAAPAWAVLADFDNDGDLDMSLIDEEADHMKLMDSQNLIGDMNYDGAFTLDDMNGFGLALAQPGVYEMSYGPKSTLQGDANHDGVLDSDDVAEFLALLPTGASFADFNADGKVDGDDLAIWSSNFGNSGTPALGDANLDGMVDGADFLAWQRALTTATQSAAPATIPEPSSIVLSALAIVVVVDRRARGKRRIAWN